MRRLLDSRRVDKSGVSTKGASTGLVVTTGVTSRAEFELQAESRTPVRAVRPRLFARDADELYGGARRLTAATGAVSITPRSFAAAPSRAVGARARRSRRATSSGLCSLSRMLCVRRFEAIPRARGS